MKLSPILEIDDAGTKRWIAGGVPHREDGPAVEWANGTKEWYRNGLFHRADGPAVERVNGDKYWYRHGQRHREDGPAVEYSHGFHVRWFLNDQEFTKPTWLREVLKDRLLTTHQRELLHALSEDWFGNPDQLYDAVVQLSPRTTKEE